MDVTTHDVLLVGGGGAGLRAAIAVSEFNPNLKVAVVSKVYPMRSHTVSAEGGAAGVIKADDSLDEHAYDTISGGDWLCDQDAVEAFVKEAPQELLQLEHWGCPWSRQEDGHIAVRPFGGMKKMRTWFAADKTGFHMLHTLFQTTMKYNAIFRYDEWFVTKLLVDDGRVQGVVAIELMSGKIQAITAKSVILCAGGCGRVFPFTTNASIKTGDGMGLAYRAGAPLKDMEFIQYHPTGLPFTGILITEAARAEGGYLVNKDGYRYLQDYNLGTPTAKPVLRSMELGPRDRLSQAFVKEQEKGRTIDGPYGPVVHLDLRHLGEKLINSKLPFVRELCTKYQNVDPVHEMIPVRPVIHYMMGGVSTDIDGATPLPGLFAAGEVACVSINGANRLGSNSLPELLVFGARAGKAAAEFASSAKPPAASVPPPSAKKCKPPWNPAPVSTAPNPRSPPAQKPFASSRSAPTTSPSTTTPSPSTPISSPPSSSPSCSTSPNPWFNPPCSAPNPAAPISARTSPSATTKNSSPIPWFSAPPTDAPALSISPSGSRGGLPANVFTDSLRRKPARVRTPWPTPSNSKSRATLRRPTPLRISRASKFRSAAIGSSSTRSITSRTSRTAPSPIAGPAAWASAAVAACWSMASRN